MPTLQLSDADKNELLHRLPPFDLSYAPSPSHKKVLGDLFLAIPRGLKCLLWFTYWREQNVCLVLPLNERGHILVPKMYVTAACFAATLSRGSIFYGTMFTHHASVHKQRCFTIENVQFYLGHNVCRLIWLKKLELLHELCQHGLAQKAYTTDFMVLGLPVMATSLDALQARVTELPYECFGYDILHSELREKVGFMKLRAVDSGPLLSAVFAVKPLLEQDMYELLLPTHSDTHALAIHNIAAVPTYQDSVLLNSIFRHIRENKNLDLLEESEDEEEHDRATQVDLTQQVRMRCVYLPRFGKWKPVEKMRDDTPLTALVDVRNVELRSGATKSLRA